MKRLLGESNEQPFFVFLPRNKVFKFEDSRVLLALARSNTRVLPFVYAWGNSIDSAISGLIRFSRR